MKKIQFYICLTCGNIITSTGEAELSCCGRKLTALIVGELSMKEDPIFIPIDMSTWPMSQAFHYYTQMAPTSYTVNVMMDVTNLRKTLKAYGYKFFPAYLYLVTRAISKQEELRVAVKDGVLGHWENLTPAYPMFHDDDKTTSLLWTEYNDCFQTFYNWYIEDTKTHGNSHGILSSKGLPLPNAYTIYCIPWFTSIVFHFITMESRITIYLVLKQVDSWNRRVILRCHFL